MIHFIAIFTFGCFGKWVFQSAFIGCCGPIVNTFWFHATLGEAIGRWSDRSGVLRLDCVLIMVRIGLIVAIRIVSRLYLWLKHTSVYFVVQSEELSEQDLLVMVFNVGVLLKELLLEFVEFNRVYLLNWVVDIELRVPATPNFLYHHCRGLNFADTS